MTTNEQLAKLDLSNLHFYSLGIVVEDNTENEKIIKVFPLEKLYTEGDNLEDDEDINVKIKKKIDNQNDKKPNYQEIPEQINLQKSKYIYASWLQLGNSNRITPPNVSKKETVLLYRYANTQNYYWTTITTDLKLRLEEHVVYQYKDNPNREPENDNLEDSYYIMVSPKTKTIKLHTTDNYGELTTYDLTIKTDEGWVELKDGKGNFFKLDSANDSLITNINNNVEKTIGNDRTTNIGHDDIINIKNNMVVTLNKVAIKNSTVELISILEELIQAIIDEQHIGNIGIPTNLTSDSIDKYKDIKERLITLKI